MYVTRKLITENHCLDCNRNKLYYDTTVKIKQKLKIKESPERIQIRVFSAEELILKEIKTLFLS